jgi:hypothetical protein
VLRFTFANGRIAAMEVIGDLEQLRALEVGVLGGEGGTSIATDSCEEILD